MTNTTLTVINDNYTLVVVTENRGDMPFVIGCPLRLYESGEVSFNNDFSTKMSGEGLAFRPISEEEYRRF